MTAGTQEHSDLLLEIAEAIAALGVDVRVDDDAVVVDGTRQVPFIAARAHPTPADLSVMIGGSGGRAPVVVVADRISDAGRDVLRAAGWGWLDRRGHLRLWAPGLRLETPLPAAAEPEPRTGGSPWTPVGLEVAVHALVHPTEPVTARRVAPVIGRSVGATHERIARFVAEGLVGPRTHLPLLPEMFWETAAHWPDDDWTPLAGTIDDVAARLGDPHALVRVDERAATLGGARIAAAGELPARCYLRSASALRRVRNLVDRDRPTKCWVRRSPVEWLIANEAHPPDDDHPWEVAHPLLCALRLAADPARGREIVEDWGVAPEPGSTS